MQKIKVSIIGGSGYAGGELLRLLLLHPNVEVIQATSERYAGVPVSLVHPNLRSITRLTFSKLAELKECDLLIIGLPNGESMGMMERFMKLAPKIIDLGADFRLQSAENWKLWYKTEHTLPSLIGKFVYGIPEIYGEEIRNASYVAGPGCEAIVSTLSLYPFFKHNLIENSPVIIDAKMGSSQGGNKGSSASHHPERAGVLRSYKPVGHRHSAEIEQVMKGIQVDISATAVDMVRGILVTIHTFLKSDVDEKALWKVLRTEYKDKPFMRIVKEKQGLYRFPEPKILSGTNYCEIGFEKEIRGNRLVIIGAIDNLVKGTSGNAVQCMNLMYGFPETMGLEFPGLHPI